MPGSCRLVYVVLLLVCAHSAYAGDARTDYHAQLLAWHNAIRAQEKLPALVNNAALAKAAQSHALHMAKTGKFAHEGIGDGAIVERIDAAGYDWAKAGENIAWTGEGTSDNVKLAMQTWFDSPPHKMQILSDYREVGFGRAVGAGGKVYWVACFGTPRP